jgi:hypothetical protein
LFLVVAPPLRALSDLLQSFGNVILRKFVAVADVLAIYAPPSLLVIISVYLLFMKVV